MEYIVKINGRKWLNASGQNLYIKNNSSAGPKYHEIPRTSICLHAKSQQINGDIHTFISDIYLYDRPERTNSEFGQNVHFTTPQFGDIINPWRITITLPPIGLNYDDFDKSVILILSNEREFTLFNTINLYNKACNHLSAEKINKLKIPAELKNIIKEYCYDEREWKGKISYVREKYIQCDHIMLE